MHEALAQFITQELLNGRDGIELKADDSLLTTGLLDSLGVMQLINFIEEAFDVSVAPEDVTIENFRTISVIAEYISRQQAKQVA
jgi:acyl carrier protein